MNLCVLFRSGVSRGSSSMFRLHFCSRLNYWFMIFDGIKAKVWSGTRSDAPRPLEDTVDFLKSWENPLQFIISLQKIRASNIGKREFKVKQEIVGNNIFLSLLIFPLNCFFYLFPLNLLLNVNTFEVSSRAVDAITHWSIMSVTVGLAARSGVRGRDKSRNNRLKITLPGELSDATLLNTHTNTDKKKTSLLSNRDHHVASPQTGSQNCCCVTMGPNLRVFPGFCANGDLEPEEEPKSCRN